MSPARIPSLLGRTRLVIPMLIWVALGPGCRGEVADRSAPVAEGPAFPFRDVAAEAGVRFEVRAARGEKTTILDTIGHGVAVADFNGDSRPDIVLAGPDRMGYFENSGGMRFVPRERGLSQAGRWGGCATGDVDNDGSIDLYVAGYGCSALYLNRHGTFENATERWRLGVPSVSPPPWGTSAGFADLDRDGWLDLVVCRYLDFDTRSPQRCATYRPGVTGVCPPKVYTPQRPRVYQNRPAAGGRNFVDVTDRWGMLGHGAALGVAFQDCNEDGRPDVAVANDERPGDLFLSEGSRWREAGAAGGAAYDRFGRVHGGMGVDWGDVDRDGRADLAVMTFFGEDKNLYRNLGGGTFEDVAWRWGLTALMRSDVAFGARLFDFDLDGRLDLMTASGHIQENVETIRPEEKYAEPVRLFRNAGTGFTELGAGRQPVIVGRGLATGDLDGDGDLDVVVSNLEGNALVLRNDVQGAHWLGIRVRTAQGAPAIGSRVTIRTKAGVFRTEVQTAGSYMSASDAGVIVGLGSLTAASVRIESPGGGSRTLEVTEVDRWVEIDVPSRRGVP